MTEMERAIDAIVKQGRCYVSAAVYNRLRLATNRSDLSRNHAGVPSPLGVRVYVTKYCPDDGVYAPGLMDHAEVDTFVRLWLP